MKVAGFALTALAFTLTTWPAQSFPLAGAPGQSDAFAGGRSDLGAPIRAQAPTAAGANSEAAAPVSTDQPAGTGGLPAAAEQAEVEYLVARGDTLSTISARLLKPDIDWRYLRALNGVTNTRALRAGQRLRIPVTWLREDAIRFTVKSVSGNATLNGGAINAGTGLGSTDTLETGDDGTVVIALPDGTEMRIAPSSQVRIDRLRKYFGGESIDARLRLERGSVDAVVPHKDQAPQQPGTIAPRIRSTAPSSGSVSPLHRIRIDTPRATAAVRGTSFRVGDTSGVSSSAVLDGLVVFGAAPSAQAATPASVDLPAGFGSAADDSGKVVEPEALLAAPTLAVPDTTVVEPSRKLEFDPIPGAAAYRVRTASDEDFTLDVTERIVTAPALVLDSRRDGTWYAAARGISANGVEGFDGTAAVQFDARPTPPILNQPPDNATQFGTRTMLEWFEPQGISTYRLQIARDPEFADLLVDEDVTTTSYTYAAGGDEAAPRKRFWRVAAVDDTGRGPVLTSRAFTQRDAGGPSASASIGAGGGATIEWAAIPDATYIVALTPLTAGATPATEIAAAQARAVLPELAPGKYEVRIISVFDGDLRSPPSDPQTFTIPLLWRSGTGEPVNIDNQTVPAVQQPE